MGLSASDPDGGDAASAGQRHHAAEADHGDAHTRDMQPFWAGLSMDRKREMLRVPKAALFSKMRQSFCSGWVVGSARE